MSGNTINWDSIRAEVLANPAIKVEYDVLESELSVARQAIALRVSMGLTQSEFAERLGMERSELESIESGKQDTKLTTLVKLAAGAGYSLEVRFIPQTGKQGLEIKPLRIAVPALDRSK